MYHVGDSVKLAMPDHAVVLGDEGWTAAQLNGRICRIRRFVTHDTVALTTRDGIVLDYFRFPKKHPPVARGDTCLSVHLPLKWLALTD